MRWPPAGYHFLCLMSCSWQQSLHPGAPHVCPLSCPLKLCGWCPPSPSYSLGHWRTDSLCWCCLQITIRQTDSERGNLILHETWSHFYLLEVVTAGKLKISVPGCAFPAKLIIDFWKTKQKCMRRNQTVDEFRGHAVPVLHYMLTEWEELVKIHEWKLKRIREDPLTNVRITNTRGGVQLTKDFLLLGLHHRWGVLQLGKEGRQVADAPRGSRVTPWTKQRTETEQTWSGPQNS